MMTMMMMKAYRTGGMSPRWEQGLKDGDTKWEQDPWGWDVAPWDGDGPPKNGVRGTGNTLPRCH